MKSKPQFQKMVLVPFDSIQKMPKMAMEEIDFSKQTDTPFMHHIKIGMKKILRNPQLGMREKARLYNQQLRKYQITKENLERAKVTTIAPHATNVQVLHEPAPSAHIPQEDYHDEDDEPWWDDMSIGQDENNRNRYNVPPPHQAPYDMTDDDESKVDVGDGDNDDDISVHSDLHQGSHPSTSTFGQRFRKRNFYETADPDIDETRVKQIRAVAVPKRRLRRNAVDSPPNPQARLRQRVPRTEVPPPRIVPSDHPSIVDLRFKKHTRKREASKIFSGKKGWLGRRKTYYTPPTSKHRKFVSSDSEEEKGAEEGFRWSKLPK